MTSLPSVPNLSPVQVPASVNEFRSFGNFLLTEFLVIEIFSSSDETRVLLS